MRTEAEIREALRQLLLTTRDPHFLNEDLRPDRELVMGAIDLVRWVLGDPESKFESAFLAPCRRVDRAGRQ